MLTVTASDCGTLPTAATAVSIASSSDRGRSVGEGAPFFSALHEMGELQFIGQGATGVVYRGAIASGAFLMGSMVGAVGGGSAPVGSNGHIYAPRFMIVAVKVRLHWSQLR
jgi:hypothetical protein